MSYRSILLLPVAGGLVISTALADAGGSPPPPAAPAVVNETYVFPATSFAANSTEVEKVRISAVNIAPNARNGTPASCSVSIAFNDFSGPPSFPPPTKVATGAITVGEYTLNTKLGFVPPPPARSEVQGMVQIEIDPASPAPCSLLLTLEVYDSTTGKTRGIVTSAVQSPIPAGPAGQGRGR